MKKLNGLEKFKPKRYKKPIIVAIGTFDGVHLAHQTIIKKSVNAAKRKNGTSVVLTFYPHPMQITDPGKTPALLTSIEHRIDLIARLKPDICLIAGFQKRFAAMGPEKFVKEVLLKKLNVSQVIVGDNFRFGKDGSGNIGFLRRFSRQEGFKVLGLKAIKRSGEVVSSSLIRKLIEAGRLEKAKQLLGRRFSVLGTVVKGDSRGRVLGYPTANIDPHQEALPPKGVYAIKARINGKWFKGMLNIGMRPTFYKSADRLAIEANIFQFNNHIYGQTVEIFFIKKIRNEKKFRTAGLLKKQLENDKMLALSILDKKP